MAALTAAGETAAAEWAAVAFFLIGAYRCLLLQVPWFNETLRLSCLAEHDTRPGNDGGKGMPRGPLSS